MAFYIVQFYSRLAIGCVGNNFTHLYVPWNVNTYVTSSEKRDPKYGPLCYGKDLIGSYYELLID